MMTGSIYRNKPDYDPGRFRESLSFVVQQSTQTPSGGSVVTENTVLNAKAIKLPVNDSAQLEINVGATSMNNDVWFVIRTFPDFAPLKNMQVSNSGKKYTIRAIVPKGEPQRYWKLLCTYKNDQDQGT